MMGQDKSERAIFIDSFDMQTEPCRFRAGGNGCGELKASWFEWFQPVRSLGKERTLTPANHRTGIIEQFDQNQNLAIPITTGGDAVGSAAIGECGDGEILVLSLMREFHLMDFDCRAGDFICPDRKRVISNNTAWVNE